MYSYADGYFCNLALKGLKDTIWDQNFIFYILCINWFTCTVWMVDENSNVRGQVVGEI